MVYRDTAQRFGKCVPRSIIKTMTLAMMKDIKVVRWTGKRSSHSPTKSFSEHAAAERHTSEHRFTLAILFDIHLDYISELSCVRGARHGLSLSGKLNRIEEQERQLLGKYSNNFDSNAAQEVFKDWVKVDTRKKKKHKIKTAATHEIAVTSPDSEKLATLLNHNDYVVKYQSKKKKRKHKAIDEDLATSLSKCLSTTQSSDATQTTKSDEKLRGVLESSSVIKKKSKGKVKVEKSKNKKKRKPKIDVGFTVDEDVEFTEVDGITPEQRKYLKYPKHSPDVDTAVDEVDKVNVKQTKKCKRKHKETKAVKSECSGDDGVILKVSKREKSKLIKNNRKIEKIAKKLENIMSLMIRTPPAKSP